MRWSTVRYKRCKRNAFLCFVPFHIFSFSVSTFLFPSFLSGSFSNRFSFSHPQFLSDRDAWHSLAIEFMQNVILVGFFFTPAPNYGLDNKYYERNFFFGGRTTSWRISLSCIEVQTDKCEKLLYNSSIAEQFQYNLLHVSKNELWLLVPKLRTQPHSLTLSHTLCAQRVRWSNYKSHWIHFHLTTEEEKNVYLNPFHCKI